MVLRGSPDLNLLFTPQFPPPPIIYRSCSISSSQGGHPRGALYVFYEWGMSHMNWICHSRRNELVMSHMRIWMRYVTYGVVTSRPRLITCEPAMSRMNQSCHTWMYSWLQIGWHSILRLFLKTFNLVPGVPGFSWDLWLVPFICGTNRKSHGPNSGSLEFL